ncbi:hypothetical protein Tco_0379358 [Tanacetum coccineum]
MDTKLLKEELTHILIWVKLHDVPIHVFEEDGISLIATFIEADLVDVVTIGIPSLSEDAFTKETTNDGFQTVGKKMKRKGKSKSTNGGQFTGPSTTGNSSKKDNLFMSNSFSALNKEEEEEEEYVENVYDELANLIQNTKSGGSSSFTVAVGLPTWHESVRCVKGFLLEAHKVWGEWINPALMVEGENGREGLHCFSCSDRCEDTGPTRGGDRRYSGAIAKDAHTEVGGDQGGAADSERERANRAETEGITLRARVRSLELIETWLHGIVRD